MKVPRSQEGKQHSHPGTTGHVMSPPWPGISQGNLTVYPCAPTGQVKSPCSMDGKVIVNPWMGHYPLLSLWPIAWQGLLLTTRLPSSPWMMCSPRFACASVRAARGLRPGLGPQCHYWGQVPKLEKAGLSICPLNLSSDSQNIRAGRAHMSPGSINPNN